jgi:hypothetical protein
LLQKGGAQVMLEGFGSEELLDPHAGGSASSGAIHLGSPAHGLSFLLDPGGRDYVGNNSYDYASRVDE